MTWIIYKHIDSPFLLSFILSLALVGLVVSVKNIFEHANINVYYPEVGAD